MRLVTKDRIPYPGSLSPGMHIVYNGRGGFYFASSPNNQLLFQHDHGGTEEWLEVGVTKQPVLTIFKLIAAAAGLTINKSEKPPIGFDPSFLVFTLMKPAMQH